MMQTTKLAGAAAALALTLGAATVATAGPVTLNLAVATAHRSVRGAAGAPTASAAGPALPTAPAPITRLSAEQRLRRQKCAYLWRKLYPWSYRPELADFFCGEHERAGLGPMWWHSLVYGVSGSELRPSMICVGGSMVSRGLMDCAWTFARSRRTALEPLLSGVQPWGPGALFNPWVSIRCHVLELRQYHEQTGRADWALLRVVFLPAAPDGARTRREQRRWERLERGHLRAVQAALAAGLLPTAADVRLAQATPTPLGRGRQEPCTEWRSRGATRAR